jgi:1-acyl-sn-glycerol-3-phosphate acyltransferase
MTAAATDPVRRYPDPLKGAVTVLQPGYLLLMMTHGQIEFSLPARALTSHWDWMLLGFSAGFLLPFCYWNGYRIVGLVPVALSVVLSCGTAGLLWDDLEALWGIIPAAYGLLIGASSRFSFRNWSDWRVTTHRRWVATPPKWDFVIVMALFVALWIQVAITLSVLGPLPRPEWFRLAATTSFFAYGFLLTAFAWFRLFRPFFELCVEPVLWLGYRVRGSGPGLSTVPYHGPLLVVVNHACWWDPLFIAKLLPRPVTPMMTSRFYDLWFLRPLMAHTFQVIRVPESSVRRETPEIGEAIAALDAGKCVILFPEGFLRRKEEQPIRRFGRGVWEIVRARPETPVLAGWIEGAWGSWASYYNGKPAKNKRLDVRRLIRVGLAEPVTLKPELLETHLPARIALMNMVIAARAHIGLPPLPAVELPTRDEEAATSEEERAARVCEPPA